MSTQERFSSIRFVLRGGLAVLLFAAMLNGRVDVERERRLITEEAFAPLRFPPSSWIATLALNYRTAAADLLWISLVVDFGERVRLGLPLPDDLIDNAHAIVDLDPAFYAVYDWAPAAYLNRRGRISEEHILQANTILDRGLQVFRDDFDLPYSAAMNFVGFSRGASDERREREVRRAIEYLEIAASRPGATETVALNLAWFQRRLRQLVGDEDAAGMRQREIEMLSRLVQVAQEPDLKEALLLTLRARGGSDADLVRATRELHDESTAARASDPAGWLPIDLWLATGPASRTEESP